MAFGGATLNGSAAFDVADDGSATGTVALGALNVTSTTLSLSKLGVGTLEVDSASTGAGTSAQVNVAAGTLATEHASALTAAPRVSLAAATTWSLGSATTAETLTGTGTVLLNGDNLTIGDAANAPLAASYSGFVPYESAAYLTTPPTLASTATAASPIGAYPITAAGAADSNYNITYVAGTLSIYGAPTSSVNNNLSISSTDLISGTVSASQAGPAAPGIASVAIYLAVDSGAFGATPIATLAPTNLSFTYPATPQRHYYFRSVATDAAGHVESKPITVEAGIYAPIPAPVTAVALATPNTSTGTIALKLNGTDKGGGGLASFEVYVRVDNEDGTGYGPAKLVGTVPAGSPDGSGTYHGSITYQAPTDGVARNDEFFSVGTDTGSVVEPMHSSPDVTLTNLAFTAPLQFTGLTIQHGAIERSFVEYVDLDFNQAGVPLTALYNSIVANPSAYLRLLEQPLGGSSDQVVPLTGVKITLDSVDRAIELDFGQYGLGGVARGTMSLLNYWKAMTAADGWYELNLDPTGSSNFAGAPHGSFERLLGDTNGDGTVDATDVNLVAARQGLMGIGLASDLNGDGTVDSTDTYLVGKSKGRSLGTNPFS